MQCGSTSSCQSVAVSETVNCSWSWVLTLVSSAVASLLHCIISIIDSCILINIWSYLKCPHLYSIPTVWLNSNILGLFIVSKVNKTLNYIAHSVLKEMSNATDLPLAFATNAKNYWTVYTDILILTSSEQKHNKIGHRIRKSCLVFVSGPLKSLHHSEQSFKQVRLRQHRLQIVYNVMHH